MDSNKGCGLGGIVVIALLVVAMFAFKNLWKVLLLGIAVVVILLVVVITVLSKNQKDNIEKQATKDGNINAKIMVYRKKLSELMHFYYNIHDKEVKSRLKKIEKMANQMLDIVHDDARDIDKAGRFLRTSLDGAKRMMESYRRLEKAPDNIDEVNRAKLEAIEVLDKMITAFDIQIKRLYENDVLNMDVETEVLDKTLDERWPEKENGQSGDNA